LEIALKIVVDAMGGDHAPKAIVAGVIEAIKEFNVNVVLVGVKEHIEKELAKYKYPKENIEIVHTDESVGMNEPATTSIRKKKNSSISLNALALRQLGGLPPMNHRVSITNFSTTRWNTDVQARLLMVFWLI